MQNTFGSALRQWRAQRRMSQLDLGLTANVSARHISFLETGRSRPSREMILQLGETLEIPRNARNAMLNAAGFATVYRARPLDSVEMAPVREAVEWTISRHEPYPALVLDRHWVLLMANRPAQAMAAAFGIAPGDSLLDAMADPSVARDLFENWPEVARHTLARLRTESAHLGGDPVLDAAADRLAADPDIGAHDQSGMLAPFIPARYRAGGAVLSFMSTIAQFGTAEDIALADLRIEMLFPADEATRHMLLAAAQQAPEETGA